MAKTIQQIQAMITAGYDVRQIINEIADYLQANPGGGGSIPAAGWYSVADYGIVGDGATDNSSALQDLIDTIAAAGENAVVFFPMTGTGEYILDGPYQDTSRGNAVILFPSVDIESKYFTITFLGEGTPTFSPSVYDNMPLPSGVKIITTKTEDTNTEPSLFGGKGPIGGPSAECSYVTIEFENLIIQVPQNPVITPINMRHVSNTRLKNVAVVAGDSFGVLDTVEPTHDDVYGIIQPDYGHGTLQKCEGIVMAVGFYNGFRVGENCVADELQVWSCNKGTLYDISHGIAIIHRLSVGWCKTSLKVRDVCRIKIDMLNTERWQVGYGGVTSEWFDFVIDIEDPSNNAQDSEIIYNSARANVGYVSQLLTLSGGNGIITRNTGKDWDVKVVTLFGEDFSGANTSEINGRLTPTGGIAWTKHSGSAAFGITSNKGHLITNATVARYSLDVLTRNVDYIVVVGPFNGFSDNPFWVYLAYTDENNYIISHTGTLEAYKKIAGVQSSLHVGSGTTIEGTAVRYNLNGSVFTMYRNDVEIYQTDDATLLSLTGTKVGLYVDTAQDSFLIGMAAYSV